MKLMTPILLCATLACGGVPRPRITNVEEACTTEWGDSSERYEVSYRDDRIQSVQVTSELDDWDSRTRLEFTYSDDRIASISKSEEGEEREEVTFDYDGDRVERATWTWCEQDGCETEEAVYSYNDAGQLVTEEVFEEGVLGETWEYSWSGDQLREITNSWGDEGGFSYVSFSYDSDDQLERATDSDGDATRFRFTDGRLDRVTDSRNRRWQIEYDSDGRMEEIVEQFESGRCSVRYTYEDGEVAGVMPVPLLPYGDRVDMSGQTLRDHPVINTGLFID